jgi:hypothetical protein
MLLRFLTFFAVTFLTACSYINTKYVSIVIDSEPSGAKFYIDGKYVDITTNEINLVPDKDKELTVEKAGYYPARRILKTSNNLRETRSTHYKKCRTDFLGSIFILPIFAWKSPHCRDFSKKVYTVELAKMPVGAAQKQSASQGAMSQKPGVLQNYYPTGSGAKHQANIQSWQQQIKQSTAESGQKQTKDPSKYYPGNFFSQRYNNNLQQKYYGWQ